MTNDARNERTTLSYEDANETVVGDILETPRDGAENLGAWTGHAEREGVDDVRSRVFGAPTRRAGFVRNGYDGEGSAGGNGDGGVGDFVAEIDGPRVEGGADAVQTNLVDGDGGVATRKVAGERRPDEKVRLAPTESFQ
jgi:hypothetical protein